MNRTLIYPTAFSQDGPTNARLEEAAREAQRQSANRQTLIYLATRGQIPEYFIGQVFELPSDSAVVRSYYCGIRIL